MQGKIPAIRQNMPDMLSNSILTMKFQGQKYSGFKTLKYLNSVAICLPAS